MHHTTRYKTVSEPLVCSLKDLNSDPSRYVSEGLVSLVALIVMTRACNFYLLGKVAGETAGAPSRAPKIGCRVAVSRWEY